MLIMVVYLIGDNSYFGFTDEELIQKYQDKFPNYKVKGLMCSLDDSHEAYGTM